MKLRNLNQNRLSMVVVLLLPPVERRFQKKWKRRWAVESGHGALCFFLFPVLLRSGFVPGWFYCLLVFMGLPARGGVFQAARLHLVLWCLTPSELGR